MTPEEIFVRTLAARVVDDTDMLKAENFIRPTDDYFFIEEDLVYGPLNAFVPAMHMYEYLYDNDRKCIISLRVTCATVVPVVDLGVAPFGFCIQDPLASLSDTLLHYGPTTGRPRKFI